MVSLRIDFQLAVHMFLGIFFSVDDVNGSRIALLCFSLMLLVLYDNIIDILLKVHWGRLKSGEEVAIKVRYPGLEKTMYADLSFLRSISAAATFFFSGYKLDWVFRELQQKITKEMDFMSEIHNSQRLRKNFEKRNDVR